MRRASPGYRSTGMPVITVMYSWRTASGSRSLPEESFATDLIMNSDLTDLRYLYQFGEYISENEMEDSRASEQSSGRD